MIVFLLTELQLQTVAKNLKFIGLVLVFKKSRRRRVLSFRHLKLEKHNNHVTNFHYSADNVNIDTPPPHPHKVQSQNPWSGLKFGKKDAQFKRPHTFNL